jgi:DNA polymerase
MIVTVVIKTNNELEMIESVAAKCTLCELCANRINPVFSRGNGFSFMICGMIPGPDENKVGSPFVGRSGKLLDVILNELKLLNDVYITNIVKCALKPGISLTQEWIDNCIVYLLAQLELTKPSVIVTLGADATNGLLGNPLDTKIGSLRGKAHLYMNTHVVPTYHPSYLLRGGGVEHKHYSRVKEDFELAKFIWQAKIKEGGS